MNALTDEIRAACTEIAANQKGIYQLGYEDGKKSVKHMNIYIHSDEEEVFCALSGMTWREFAVSELSSGRVVIKDDKVYFSGAWGSQFFLDYDADDEIVDRGEYYALRNILYGEDEFYVSVGSSFGDMVEEYNKEKYYVDEKGFVRAKDGRMLIWSEGVGPSHGVLSHYYYDEMLSYGLTSDTDVVSFTLDYHDSAVAKRNSTWAEWCDSLYSNGSYYVNGDSVTGMSDEIIQLDGINVKPTDVITEGAAYSFYY